MASLHDRSAFPARSQSGQSAYATHAPGYLNAEPVRRACTAPNTKKAYRSYLKGFATWIQETQGSPDRFFEDDVSINLRAFMPSHFEEFLMHKMNGGALKVSTLCGYRSALKDTYRQKRLDLPPEYLDDLKTLSRGLKRVEADNDQAGLSRKSGKEPLTFSIYTEVAESTLMLDDNGFAHLFLLSQWNLMCRSKSVETLHIAYLQSADDSIGCVLHKTKTNQEGSGHKDPGHICANPMQPSCCWVLALGVYLASNPTLVAGKLFPGSNQKSRFCKTLGKLLETLTGQKIYGTHSIRKGVATYASSGSTGGPSIVSVCLRGGWTLGGVQDRYFRYEAAGDQFLGRVVAGLTQNSSHFAVLPAHFEDPRDGFVLSCTAHMFPALKDSAHIAPVLHLCLASLTMHASFLREKLSQKHPLLSSYAFRDLEVMARLRGLLITGSTSWMRPTEIPPHVELFQQHLETRTALRQLPDVLLDGFGMHLEDRNIGHESITRETLGFTIRSLLQEAGLWQSRSSYQQEAPPQATSTTTYYWPSDGRFHRMPEDFTFTQLDVLGVWRQWWLGNPAAGYPPFRALHTSDFSRPNRKMYSEWSVPVRHITSGIEAGDTAEMHPPTTKRKQIGPTTQES